MRKLKVMVVENDEDEQFFIKQAFEETGLYNIIRILSDGENIIDILKQTEDLPDLIITDMNMYGKNGLDILDEVKNSPDFSHIHVTVISNTAAHAISEKCLQLGGSYRIKPDNFTDYKKFAKELHTEIHSKMPSL